MIRQTCGAAAIIVILLLQACAAPQGADSAYNQGVAAYRAKDFATARKHWASSVADGDLSAQNNLGYLLYYGLGGERDTEGAVRLWRKAATAGHPEALWHLGDAYQDGDALPQSHVEAYAWYRCAVATAEAGSEGEDGSVEQAIANDARKSLEKLLGQLSRDEFERGEVLAKQYIAKYSGLGRGA
jgi:TPR repeat protein